MSAFSTKGLTVWLQKLPGAAPDPIDIVSVTAAKPSVMSVAIGDIGSFVNGDTVTISGTGNAALDGKSFTVSSVNVPANTMKLNGADTTVSGAVGAVGTANVISADFLEFCAASLDRTQAPAQAISVGTTCDPAAQLAGEPQAGTLSVSGFVDFASAGFIEFMKSVDDGIPRVLLVKLPTTATAPGVAGTILYPSVTASGFSETYAVNAAAAFTGEFTLGSKPIYTVA